MTVHSSFESKALSVTAYPSRSDAIFYIIMSLFIPVLWVICLRMASATPVPTSVTDRILYAILYIFTIAFFLLSTYWLLRMVIVSCKQCEYTEQGCTISILGYRKTYLWSEIKSKYYDSFAGTRMGGNYSQFDLDDGIFFSTHKYKRSNRTVPNQYAARHPLSSFYVVFPPAYLNKTDKFLGLEIKYAPPAYMVDRDEFLALLESWGVELTDIRATRPPRNQ